MVFYGGHFVALMDLKVWEQESLFDVFTGRWVEIRNLDEIVIFEFFLRDAHLFWEQADGGEAAALAVSPIVHLNRAAIDVLAGDGN